MHNISICLNIFEAYNLGKRQSDLIEIGIVHTDNITEAYNKVNIMVDRNVCIKKMHIPLGVIYRV